MTSPPGLPEAVRARLSWNSADIGFRLFSGEIATNSTVYMYATVVTSGTVDHLNGQIALMSQLCESGGKVAVGSFVRDVADLQLGHIIVDAEQGGKLLVVVVYPTIATAEARLARSRDPSILGFRVPAKDVWPEAA